MKSYAKNFNTGEECRESVPWNSKFEIYGQPCIGSGHSFSNASLSTLNSAPVLPAIGLVTAGFGKKKSSHRNPRLVGAFTLIEAMIALGVMVLFVAACLSAIVFNQVAVRKAKEQAIAMDFLTKYAETIKALPYNSVVTALPINNLFNGTSGAPLIVIPANNTWVSLNTTAYQTFYPDLLWFSNRNPQMQVTLSNITIDGVPAIEINVKFDWDPPLSKGGRQEVVVDFLRTRDVPNL